MPKRIIDIRPPTIQAKKIIEKMKPQRGFAPLTCPKFDFRFVYIGIGLIGLFLFCWVVLCSAKIEIWPKTRALIFEETIVVKAGIADSDFSQNIIAGKTIQIEKEVSQQLNSTGFIDKKAKGIIRVYNAYSTYDQPLLATTRFVSASGKLFRTPVRVVIPGKHYKKGKLVPGFIDIEVVADQTGEKYNIEPTTFSIPGFAGTSKFTLFYAKSFSEMKGGGRFPQVNDNDLNRAKKVLSAQAKEKCWEKLRTRAQENNLILFDDAVSQKITDAFSLAQAGAEQEQFDYKVKASFTAITLPEQDLENYIENFFDSQIFEGEKLHKLSLKTNYSLKSADFEHNKVILDLEFSGDVYSDIDILFLKKALVEKSSREVKIILESEDKIDKFEFELWPFWVKKVPNNLEKIDVKLNLD